MSEKDSKDPKGKKSSSGKKEYVTPKVTSEELMTFGALCNGMIGSGRKASTGAPNFCSSTKLLS